MLRLVLGCWLFVGACSEHSKPAPDPASAAAATRKREAELCPGLRFRGSLELWICGEVGERNVAIDIVDAAGASMGVVQAGAKMRIVDKPKILREPGQMDEQVCITSGERSGTVGYVRNVHFWGADCPN